MNELEVCVWVAGWFCFRLPAEAEEKSLITKGIERRKTQLGLPKPVDMVYSSGACQWTPRVWG